MKKIIIFLALFLFSYGTYAETMATEEAFCGLVYNVGNPVDGVSFDAIKYDPTNSQNVYQEETKVETGEYDKIIGLQMNAFVCVGRSGNFANIKVINPIYLESNTEGYLVPKKTFNLYLACARNSAGNIKDCEKYIQKDKDNVAQR